ncbi:6,7,8-trihydroxycoumarin synthase-like [Salvia miltiorrhiza]|uniref:6,7,8-trihydroxycoumarin synthase-like n=1 Tax=Salvia miltiorrhiza TaxID=226208 RepID=UPI0025AB8AA0|nr:6,7,8-trihydroxycoumarin synthase-like [Salvia miltiorrhiza]
MTPFLLLLALPIILILYFQTQNPKHAKEELPPPGPPRLPFIGNLHHFDSRSPHTYLHRLSKKYGAVMSLMLGFRRLVVISSAEAVKEIMKSHDAVFSSRPALVTFKKLPYKGRDIGFSPYNDAWRELRKISTIHLFSTKQVQSFRPIFKDELSKMMEKIARDAASSAATDLSETMMSFATNAISRAAFGRRLGDEGYGKTRFFDIFHGEKPLLGGFFVEDYLPWLRWIDSLSGMGAKLDKNISSLHSFCDELIEEHMNPDRPESMEGDVIDILLRIKREGSFHLTLDHIKGLLVDIIIGGSDTTAASLVWALTALMKKPSSMKKVQAEVRQLAGKKEMIDEEDIEKLPYLRAVVKETMRLFPPAPLLLPRETTKKCSINGYEIEGGSMVYINAWAIARDPATWENADEFLPERFLSADHLDVRGQNPEVIPFGFGRRGCPGIGIAMSEIELALANVLCKFEWELPLGMKEEAIDFDYISGLVMHKKNALRLVPKLLFA